MIATEVVAAPAGGGVGGFSVPDHEVRRVAEGARLRDLHIVALFHSHPSGATALSDSDAAALRYSEWPWIVATRPPGESQIQLTAYQPATTRSVKCSIASSRVE